MALVAGAVIWAVIVEVTGYKVGYVAVGIGVLVGAAMALKAGVHPALPVLGAVFSLAGCLLGDTLIDAYEVAKAFDVSIVEALRIMATDRAVLSEVFSAGFEPMDLLFWGIAALAGFRITAAGRARSLAARRSVPAA